jgi:hypothetical protein
LGSRTQHLQLIERYSKTKVEQSRWQLCTSIGQGPSISNTQYHHFRSCVIDGRTSIKVIPTEVQWAEMLTKPLAVKLLHKFRKAVLGWSFAPTPGKLLPISIEVLGKDDDSPLKQAVFAQGINDVFQLVNIDENTDLILRTDAPATSQAYVTEDFQARLTKTTERAEYQVCDYKPRVRREGL